MLVRSTVAVLAGMAISLPVLASDWGCEVLLCMSNPAGPTAVDECKPPIEKLWKHLAKGRSWPTCDMGAGNEDAAKQEWANENNCPPQYLRLRPGSNNDHWFCAYTGVVTINQNGQPYMKVWWTPNGESVTENLNPSAPVSASSQKFQADLAAWQAEQRAIAEWQAAEERRGN